MSVLNHEYNTRSSSSRPESANDNNQVLEAVNGIKNSLNSRFDALHNEFLNLKDVVIQRLQDDNTHLKERIAVLEKRVEDAETHSYLLEQYGRRNNVEIEGISDSISDENLESKVIDILAEIDVNVESKDIEACHRIGKSSPKRSIVRFVNRKVCKSALKNRKKLRSVDANKLGLPRTSKVFINENLSPYFSKIAFNCRKLKRAGKIMKVYSHEGIIHIVRTVQEKPKKIYHINDLSNLFPDFDFEDDKSHDVSSVVAT